MVLSGSGSYESTAKIADVSKSVVSCVITYTDAVGTTALNTDLILELSADNGSNWSTATLVAMPDSSPGIKVAKVDNLAVTAGTQLKHKITFANQASDTKVTQVNGVDLIY